MRSQTHPIALRLLALGVALAAVLGLLVGLAPAHTAAAAAPSCDRAELVDARLAELGRLGVRWRVGPTRADAWGWTLQDTGVTVSELVPCDRELIVSVVNHEWVHTLQMRAFPDRRLRSREYGRSFETVADCGSLLLGSRHTPYLDERARATCRPVGCTAAEDGAARRLLASAGR